MSSRLTDETRSGTTSSWGYDAVSNRTSQTSSGSTVSAVFDNRDRLTALGSTTFAWDVSGRLNRKTTSGTSTQYTWKDDDRLVNATLPSGGNVAYGYDAQGLLASRTDAAGTEQFTWDGTLPYGQIAASTSVSGALKSREVWGTEHLAEIRNDTVLWLLGDGLGNVRAIADSLGKIIGRQNFDAWGNRTLDSGRTVRFGYRGEWADPTTGLIFLRARWMDPQTGRFVSEDPYEGDPNGPVSLHRYLYANESPVMMKDPTGRFGIGECMASLAIDNILSVMAAPSWNADKLFGHTDEAQKEGEAQLSTATQMVESSISRLLNYDKTVPQWFGQNPDFFMVYSTFTEVRGALQRGIKFYYSNKYENGHAIPGMKDKVWLGTNFSKLNNGWNWYSKAGTIIHEITHANSFTADYAYTKPDCLFLADLDNYTAANNANSYRYFAEAGAFK